MDLREPTLCAKSLFCRTICSCIPLHYMLGLRLLFSFRFSAVVVFPFFSLTSPRRKGNFLFTWMFIQSSERAILPTRNPTLLNKFLVLFQATVIHPVPARCTSFPFSTFAICIVKDNFWSCFTLTFVQTILLQKVWPVIHICHLFSDFLHIYYLSLNCFHTFFPQMYSSPRVLPRPSHHS